jgi:sarcosine oxidase delta subunit
LLIPPGAVRATGRFRYGGRRVCRIGDPEALSDEQWGDYLFMRDNLNGDFAGVDACSRAGGGSTCPQHIDGRSGSG